MTSDVLVIDEAVRGVHDDPAPLALSGMAAARGYVDGTLARPPIHHLFGLRPTEASFGRVVHHQPMTPWLLDGLGFVPTGILPVLADGPLAAAIITTLPPGHVVSTSELSVTYVQPPVRDTAGFLARGEVLHATGHVGVSTAEISDTEGRLLGHATTRCIIHQLPFDRDARPISATVDSASDDPWRRPARGRVYTADELAGMSGLDVAKGYVDGTLLTPPVGYLNGFAMTAADDGRCAWRMPTSAWHTGPGPYLWGGILAWFAQVALDTAALTTLPAGTLCAPLDLSAHFLRPVPPDSGELRVHAEVVHRGRRVAVSSAEVVNAEGKPVLVASGSSMIVADGYRRLQRGVLPSTPDI